MQRLCDNDEDEEDKVQVFQGGLKLIKLNLTDLTIEDPTLPPDLWFLDVFGF